MQFNKKKKKKKRKEKKRKHVHAPKCPLTHDDDVVLGLKRRTKITTNNNNNINCSPQLLVGEFAILLFHSVFFLLIFHEVIILKVQRSLSFCPYATDAFVSYHSLLTFTIVLNFLIKITWSLECWIFDDV